MLGDAIPRFPDEAVTVELPSGPHPERPGEWTTQEVRRGYVGVVDTWQCNGDERHLGHGLVVEITHWDGNRAFLSYR